MTGEGFDFIRIHNIVLVKTDAQKFRAVIGLIILKMKCIETELLKNILGQMATLLSERWNWLTKWPLKDMAKIKMFDGH